MDKPQVRLSNLMALDATAFGSWGCSPRRYADALALVFDGRVKLTPFIEQHPMSEGPAMFARIAEGVDGAGRRAILIPD
jgi:6-hydroxycyclohex-1-ene-1-carbonyl-CoA dehydrogenase